MRSFGRRNGYIVLFQDLEERKYLDRGLLKISSFLTRSSWVVISKAIYVVHIMLSIMAVTVFS